MICRRTYGMVGQRLSVTEIAGAKRDAVYEWIERRGTPAHKVGSLWKFRLCAVDG
jgi:excisionase family DNA binding protein